MLTYQSNVPGYCRCYRCGGLLYNPDDRPSTDGHAVIWEGTFYKVQPLTIDRIIPGVKGGTYRRTNIRPACGLCNSETGGALASRERKA